MKRFLFISAITFSICLSLGCGKTDPSADAAGIAHLIKDIEVINTSGEPDSVKAAKLDSVFAVQEFSIETYRSLYRELTEKDPMRSIKVLTEAEKILTQEMKETAARQRKAATARTPAKEK